MEGRADGAQDDPSLKAGNTTHPIGSVAVKELFSSGAREVAPLDPQE